MATGGTGSSTDWPGIYAGDAEGLATGDPLRGVAFDDPEVVPLDAQPGWGRRRFLVGGGPGGKVTAWRHRYAGQEAVVIVVLALLVIGGSQLPKIVGALVERRHDGSEATEAPDDERSHRREPPRRYPRSTPPGSGGTERGAVERPRGLRRPSTIQTERPCQPGPNDPNPLAAWGLTRNSPLTPPGVEGAVP